MQQSRHLDDCARAIDGKPSVTPSPDTHTYHSCLFVLNCFDYDCPDACMEYIEWVKWPHDHGGGGGSGGRDT
eukprot:750920-Hanusia_phi.AAC.1